MEQNDAKKFKVDVVVLQWKEAHPQLESLV